MIDLEKRKRLLDGLKELFSEVPIEDRPELLVDLLYGALRYALGPKEAREELGRLMDDAEARRN
jgi:hypothetical protein